MRFDRDESRPAAPIAAGPKPSLSRRKFLIAGGAAGGGLLLSFTLPSLLSKAGAATAGSFTPNAFIRIDTAGGVTLTIPQVEMGQGIFTACAMLLADELEVDLTNVQLEQAPADVKLYANPLLGFQVTGGSTSIRAFFQPLRQAGASAADHAGRGRRR
jgi:isoquinoline 1-oxidoreductase subunit beta